MSAHPMAIAAARVLNARASEACNTDVEDGWKVYGDEYIKDADAALNAAGAYALLKVLEAVCNETRHPDYDWPLCLAREVSAAIAAAKGEQ